MTKTRVEATRIIFTPGVHCSVCSLTQVQVWLAVMTAHGITSGPLFPTIVAGRLQPHTRLSHTTYCTALQYMSNALKLPGQLTEHSARRGGVQYRHFVLNHSLHRLFRTLKWKDEKELSRYVGISDKDNQYAIMGFAGDIDIR